MHKDLTFQVYCSNWWPSSWVSRNCTKKSTVLIIPNGTKPDPDIIWNWCIYPPTTMFTILGNKIEMQYTLLPGTEYK